MTMASRASLKTLLTQFRYTLVQARLLTTGQNVAILSVTPCMGCLKKQISVRHLTTFSGFRSKYSRLYLSSSTKDSGSGSDGKTAPSATEPPPQVEASAKQSKVKAPDVPVNTVLKVQPTSRMMPRPKTDFTKSYTANIFITPIRAMDEYLLNSSDLTKLKTSKRRSPYVEREDITVYLRRDVEQIAIERYGSLEAVMKERLARSRGKPALPSRTWEKLADKFELRESKESIFSHGPGKVVVYAIVINGFNAMLKFVAWLYTGSHSMFSEFIHSVADTANQIILAVGIHQSLKQPDTEHPYGWANFRNVASLISGVGIFFCGAGLSCYHGIMGIIAPHSVESLYWGLAILGGSFISEAATLIMAANQIRITAKAEQLSILQYVWRGMDPSTNVVLLEDMAAVLGVAIAGGCMGITYYTGNPLADAVGSVLIGTLLGGVASFIIYTNTVALVGRSILPDKRREMMRELEDDRLIRALHDVKATDMGGSYVRFKAEVDFDGREVARLYLEKQDIETMLQSIQQIKNIEEVEGFMLKHGENIVDTLGGEVDRIEKNLKRKHPEIRHVDLEQL